MASVGYSAREATSVFHMTLSMSPSTSPPGICGTMVFVMTVLPGTTSRTRNFM